MGLQIKPGLLRLRRAPGKVQIGLDPRYGVVLAGLTPADEAYLETLACGLDPASHPHRAGGSPSGSPSGAGAGAGAGADAARAPELLRLLADAQVLVRRRSGRGALSQVGPMRSRLAADALVWAIVHGGDSDGWDLVAARVRRRVDLIGSGRTVTAVASTLAAAGVGTVRRSDKAGRDHATPVPAAPDREPPPDLAIVVERGAADAAGADRMLAADVPHLSVVVGEAGVTVGPLVVPGRGPCLRCLELHRGDRDPAWPLVLAQLLTAGGGEAPAEEAVSAGLAGSLATLQALAYLDGVSEPAAVGATLEVELPDGLVSRRPWPAHPACGCHWPPAVPVSPAFTETVTTASELVPVGCPTSSSHGSVVEGRMPG